MKKSLYFDYLALQILYFLIAGIFCGYGSYILLNFGYSPASTGTIMALGSLLAAILQQVCASISDNSKKLTLFNVCTIVSAILLALCIGIYFRKDATLLTAVLYIGVTGVYNIIEPLLNSIPTILENNGYKVNFGIGRSLGSFGYAAANAILGFLTSKYPFHIALLFSVISSLLVLIISIKISKDFESLNTTKKINKEDKTISYLQFLSGHKTFLLLIVCTVFIYLGFVMPENMMIILIEEVGGTSKDQGLILAFKACIEIPVIFFYSKLEAKFGNKMLLRIAAISFALKALMYVFSYNVTMIWLTQILQMTSLAIELPAMVSYISKIMDKKEAVRGQSMFILAVTTASICSSFLSGALVDYFSIRTMLIVGLIVSTIGAIGCNIVLSKKD